MAEIAVQRRMTTAGRRWVALSVAVALAIVAAVVIGVKVSADRLADVRSDRFYCASGAGNLDVGPRTGRLCADLLRN